VESAAVYAGAFLCGLVPSFLAGQVARPEGPGPALVRADGINSAFSPAVCLLQEHTIPGDRLFNNCRPQANASEIFSPQLSDWYFEEIGEELDFRAGDPDVARTGAGAASAATQTLKMQAGSIPRDFFALGHLFLSAKNYWLITCLLYHHICSSGSFFLDGIWYIAYSFAGLLGGWVLLVSYQSASPRS